MASWKLQDAKARFSEFLEQTLKNGPQIVTRRGVEEAVLVPIEKWRKLQDSQPLSLKELLLSPDHRFDFPEARPRLKRRKPMAFK
jgi:antitoxin Phd